MIACLFYCSAEPCTHSHETTLSSIITNLVQQLQSPRRRGIWGQQAPTIHACYMIMIHRGVGWQQAPHSSCMFYDHNISGGSRRPTIHACSMIIIHRGVGKQQAPHSSCMFQHHNTSGVWGQQAPHSLCVMFSPGPDRKAELKKQKRNLQKA